MSMWRMLLNKSGEAECRGAADVEDTDDGTIDDAEAVKRVPNKMMDPQQIKSRRSAWSRVRPLGVSQLVSTLCTMKRKRDGTPEGLESPARKRDTWMCILRR